LGHGCIFLPTSAGRNTTWRGCLIAFTCIRALLQDTCTQEFLKVIPSCRIDALLAHLRIPPIVYLLIHTSNDKCQTCRTIQALIGITPVQTLMHMIFPQRIIGNRCTAMQLPLDHRFGKRQTIQQVKIVIEYISRPCSREQTWLVHSTETISSRKQQKHVRGGSASLWRAAVPAWRLEFILLLEHATQKNTISSITIALDNRETAPR
jgi:hypothetical protein